MMTTRLLLPILLAAFAFEGPARAAGDGDIEGECDLLPPPGYIVEIGYGQGDSKAVALEQARQAAREALLESVCAPLTEIRCNGVRRAVRTWDGEEGERSRFDRRRNSHHACAVVALEQSVLDQMEREAAALDREIAAMAGRVAQADVTLLRHEAPIWNLDGCGAGVVGDTLWQRFNNALGEVRLDLGDTASVSASRFRMSLSGTSESVVVGGYLEQPGVEGAVSIEGPTFNLDLFGIEERDEAVDCRSDRALGLDGGSRVGQDGLRVRIELPEGRNTFCEGEEITPAVRVNQPARVQVYSVLRDGTAHLVWPYRGAGKVDGAEELFTGNVLADEAAGDESLVAVAVPLSGDFGTSRGWLGYCLASEDFGAVFYPPGAAVHRVAYTVRPQGGECPSVDVGETQAKYDVVPRCGP
jgi:hypothetical protein